MFISENSYSRKKISLFKKALYKIIGRRQYITYYVYSPNKPVETITIDVLFPNK